MFLKCGDSYTKLIILKTTDVYTKWVNCIVCELQLNLLLFSHQVMSDSLRPMDWSRPGSWPVSWSLFKLMSIELVMLSNHLIPCHPLSLLPSIFPSTRVFCNELALCTRWPKYWSFSITPSKDILGFLLGLTGLISLQP